MDAARFKVGDKLGKMLYAAADAIETPAREGVALLTSSQRLRQDRSIAAATRRLLDEDVVALDPKPFGFGFVGLQ